MGAAIAEGGNLDASTGRESINYQTARGDEEFGWRENVTAGSNQLTKCIVLYVKENGFI
jgi:hypothetical protein